MYAARCKTLPDWFGPANEKTLWQFDKPSDHEFHPTQKPVDLYRRSITNSSKRGQIVAEMFMGSGTTMIAAEQLDRRCFGIEIDPAYAAVTLERLSQMGLKPVLT